MNLEKVKIFDGVYLINKALWIEKKKLLAIADLHIGYEEYLNEFGIAIPRQQFKIMKEEIDKLMDMLKPEIVVINGDLKHEFGEISRQEWQETLEIIDLILNKSKLVLVKGNHDTILEPIARKKGLKIVDYYCIDKICFMHGDKLYEKAIQKSEMLVFAHIHPAISLREGIKTERFKCWLVGKWRIKAQTKAIIIMPSFLFYIEGLDIRNYYLDYAFLRDIKNFEV